MRRPGRTRIGPSGWSYPHWRGSFFPPELPARRWLAHLAERFDTVEVNGTFYRLQRPACFDAWRAEVGPEFVFAVKASRYVTHRLRLGGGRAPLANFFAQGVLRLGAQLGPILWQLPPQLGFDGERLLAFLKRLPRDLRQAELLARRHDTRLRGRAALRAPDGHERPLRHALEARHPSWFAPPVLELLRRFDVALVSADSAGRYPLSIERTASFAYARLHGSQRLYGGRYRDDELDRWAALVRRWRDGGDDVYVYFDNDERGFAAADARRLRERVERGRRRA
jgi:uncharacterized protein YecE (DUF72 family)